jgi:hypothetical protein
MALLLILMFLAGGAAPISIDVTPKRHVGPRAAFRVVVTVERDARNQALMTLIDGTNYLRRSVEQLDGEDAPRVRANIFEDVPEGHYVITAAVQRNDGSVKQASTEACVLGPDADCQ